MDRRDHRRNGRRWCGIALAVGMSLVGTGPAGARSPREDPDARYRVPVKGQPYTGTRHALVTVAVWGGFQCPWTARAMKILDRVMRKYGRNVRLVWFDLPMSFHKQSLPASAAGREVFAQRGHRGFWRFARTVFTGQADLDRGGARAEDLIRRAARAAGADVRLVLGAYRLVKHRKAIDNASALGQRIGVRGTPTVIINGRKFRGRRSFVELAKTIVSEKVDAEHLISQGRASRRTVYRVLQRGTHTTARYLDEPAPRPRLDPNAVYRVPVRPRTPYKGAAAPLVTLVAYMDFQCPYCKWAACVLRRISKHFRRDVKVVFHNNPLAFHRDALPAAEAVMEAYAQKGNRGFWAMHDRIFPMQHCKTPLPHIRTWLRNLPRSTHGRIQAARLRSAASAIGLNLARYDRAMRTGKHRARIKRQQRLAGSLGARGTPSFFVNGLYIRGIRPFSRFKQIIEEEIRKAKRLLRRRRLSRRTLYKHIIRKGARAPVYLPTKP